MAKNKAKKRTNSRFHDVMAMAVVLVPAVLAAITAFMNTAFARDNGLSWEDLGAGDTKKTKRGKRA